MATQTAVEKELREELEKAYEHIHLLQSRNRVLTCVYCGHQYPPGTLQHGARVLTDHISRCPQHPMAKVVQERDLLRRTLADLLGGSTPDELDLVEDAVELTFRKKDAEHTRLLQAIAVLRATAPSGNEAS